MGAATRLLDLLVPPRCPGCGREGDLVCPRCWSAFTRRLAEPPGAPVGLRARLPVGLVQLEWCASFRGPVRGALHVLKYDGERRLAVPLGGLLAQRWHAAGAGGDLLVPVPVHAERLRERGYDQAALLAEVAGGHLGLAAVAALERRQPTAAQHGLGREERERNLRAAFAVDEPMDAVVTGRWPVLIDDVVTTGATLSACALALRRAGAVAVSALTVAHEL